jgi:hypothetical protein
MNKTCKFSLNLFVWKQNNILLSKELFKPLAALLLVQILMLLSNHVCSMPNSLDEDKENVDRNWSLCSNRDIYRA